MLQKTHIFKEKFIIFQNFPENVISDLYIISKQLYIIKLSSYIKEQLTLNHLLGW